MAATTKAIVIVEKGKAEIQDVPMPALRDEWILVKVKAVAINPTDWKHIDYGGADPGSKSGCDYAGVVEAVGSKVTRFKKGDRIAGSVHGGDRVDHENGSFGHYLIAKECIQFKIPDNLTFEQATTLGVSIVTVGQGLFKALKLPLPNAPTKNPFPILIYGGSTATGIMGIQFAKAAGLTVVTTASPQNFDYLKSLGADAVFDYKSPTCAADIKSYTGGKITRAWDCLGFGTEICAAAMSDTEPGIYATISLSDKEVLNKTNPLVEGPHLTMGYDAFGEKYVFMGREVPAKPDEMEFATNFVALSIELLANGTIKPINQTVNKNGSGLEGVLKGLDEMRAGNVSGTKLVYTL